jgi:hypothetical protein
MRVKNTNSGMASRMAGNRYTARNRTLTWRRPKNCSRAIA